MVMTISLLAVTDSILTGIRFFLTSPRFEELIGHTLIMKLNGDEGNAVVVRSHSGLLQYAGIGLLLILMGGYFVSWLFSDALNKTRARFIKPFSEWRGIGTWIFGSVIGCQSEAGRKCHPAVGQPRRDDLSTGRNFLPA